MLVVIRKLLETLIVARKAKEILRTPVVTRKLDRTLVVTKKIIGITGSGRTADDLLVNKLLMFDFRVG